MLHVDQFLLPRFHGLQSVGAFHAPFAVEMVSYQPGEPSDISLRFAAWMDLVAGDILRLEFPDFSGTESTARLESLPADLFQSLASWSNETRVLTITVVADIPASSDIRVTIEASSGIVLPVNGIRANSTQYSISANATAGIVPATSVLMYPVGAFEVARLSFGNEARASGLCSLTLTVNPYMAIATGDKISLYLAGFSGEAWNGTVSYNDGIGYCDAFVIWRPLAQTLDFTLACGVDAGTEVSFAPHKSTSGLSLFFPTNGVPADDRDILISVTSTDGPMKSARINTVQSVGFINAGPDVLPAEGR